MATAEEAFVNVIRSVKSWFDTAEHQQDPSGPVRVDLSRVLSFVFLHVGFLGLIWVGWSPFAVGFAIASYFARMFFITGFYHRYFSHRTFDTSRPMQFLFAVAGNTAVQRGALWWAAQHRHHHAHSDEPEDPHSPVAHGLYWSHMGWLTSQSNFRTRHELIPDLAKYPELRWLDRFDTAVPALYAVGTFLLGFLLNRFVPALGVDGPQMLVWGFFISTAALLHATCLVNSAAHWWGSRPYKTTDQSRNNLWVALVTLGEGWHNNHHHYPASARQGFRWWEIDVTYYMLKAMGAIGLIRKLRPVPAHALTRGRNVHSET